MPKVSVNILTKNRAELLKKALASVANQTFKDFEVVLISDGSTDNTEEVEQEFIRSGLSINFRFNNQSSGITLSREEALTQSKGEYVAILDDDDEWLDINKLKKQVKFLDENPEVVLVGGGILVDQDILKLRPESDPSIRKAMLFRNNFFTSTVMFRREAAIKAGGFVKDGADLAEDYDLWLRLGKTGKMHNFREAFAFYRQSPYNKERFKQFLVKQLRLVKREKGSYPFYYLAAFLLKLRIYGS